MDIFPFRLSSKPVLEIPGLRQFSQFVIDRKRHSVIRIVACQAQAKLRVVKVSRTDMKFQATSSGINVWSR